MKSLKFITAATLIAASSVAMAHVMATSGTFISNLNNTYWTQADPGHTCGVIFPKIGPNSAFNMVSLAKGVMTGQCTAIYQVQNPIGGAAKGCTITVKFLGGSINSISGQGNPNPKYCTTGPGYQSVILHSGS